MTSLLERMESKEYRDAFVAAEMTNAVVFQIRALMSARHLTQEKLGEMCGMKQEAVSRLLSRGVGRPSSNTLLKLASALDVAVVTHFVPFSELAEWSVNLSLERLAPPSYGEEAQ